MSNDQSLSVFIEQILTHQTERSSDFALGYVIGTLKERERRLNAVKALNKSTPLSEIENHKKKREEIEELNKSRTVSQGYQNRMTPREVEIYRVKLKKTLETVISPMSINQICSYADIPILRYSWVYGKLREMAEAGILTKSVNPKNIREHLYILTVMAVNSNITIKSSQVKSETQERAEELAKKIIASHVPTT